MADRSTCILYLDDYHAGDVLFLQSLARGLARRSTSVSPVVVHGSGEHAERLLESKGIFRERRGGVLAVENVEEYGMVERAARHLNQKLVSILTEAVVASVGVMGDQRRMFVVKNGHIEASGAAWIGELLEHGIVPVVSAFARDEAAGTTGEIPMADAVTALARAHQPALPTIVFFTSTNLPGIMRHGERLETIDADAPAFSKSVVDISAVEHILATGAAEVLLTNTTRFGDAEGPTGTRIILPQQSSDRRKS